MNDLDGDRLMTVEDLAAFLRTTPNAVASMRHRRQGPPALRVGKRLLFRRSDVDRWVAARVRSV